MEKSNKTLSNVITVIYAVVAAGWLISSILQFRTAKGVMSTSGSVLYFVPLLLMLVVVGIEINRLKKEKYKVLDAVVFLILPIVIMIALVMSGVSMGSADGENNGFTPNSTVNPSTEIIFLFLERYIITYVYACVLLYNAVLISRCKDTYFYSNSKGFLPFLG